MIARRHRHQTGTVWLKSGSWYLRFYTDVGGKRKQLARFLEGPRRLDDRQGELRGGIPMKSVEQRLAGKFQELEEQGKRAAVIEILESRQSPEIKLAAAERALGGPDSSTKRLAEVARRAFKFTPEQADTCRSLFADWSILDRLVCFAQGIVQLCRAFHDTEVAPAYQPRRTLG